MCVRVCVTVTRSLDMSAAAVSAARRVSHQLRVQEAREGRARKQGLCQSLRKSQSLLTISKALKHGQHIELRNVPLTATTADLQRAIDRVKLQDVQDCDFYFFLSKFDVLMNCLQLPLYTRVLSQRGKPW